MRWPHNCATSAASRWSTRRTSKSHYCVATNDSQAREPIVRRGSLLDAMLASIAIPGALPPMISDGDLPCDGGIYNNFPVDVMRGMRGVGRVIGVDLSYRKPRRITHAEVLDGAAPQAPSAPQPRPAP